LNDVRQLGIDRVVDFVFGTGKSEYHLLVELYANGNILLTDPEYKILTLMRTYKVDDNFVATNRIYPINSAKEMLLPDFETLKNTLANADDKDNLKKLCISVVGD
jgi:predicted ribosome quality control (RQC) complex YloA/Tae2 family protein